MRLLINAEDLGNKQYIQKEDGLRFFAAERSVYCVGAYDADFQVCQVTFSRKDGSIFVSCPYFPERKSGLLSVATWPAEPPYTLSLQDRGKVTSHLVKFSHHPDGQAHFSQDGKIKTTVTRQSFPLPSSIGQVFQLHLYHLHEFAPIQEASRKRGRAYLTSRFRESLPHAVVVKAEWRRKADIIANIEPPGGSTGPIAQVLSRRSNDEFTVTFLAQPDGFPLTTHVLMLSCYPTTLLSEISEPTMIFIGGYDEHERKPDEPDRGRQAKECLVWMYPVSSAQELAERIGSVDLHPTASAA